MLHWETVEAKLPKYQTLKERSKLGFRIKLYSIAFCICAVAEHLLTAISTIYYVKACDPDSDPVAGFFEEQLIQLFSITKFALWKGLLGKMINVMAAFVWNYMNIFVVIISIGISSKFKQLNEELIRIKGEVKKNKCFSA